jgi:pimeloyl-ACP methyl ester carboxylesterase
MNIVSQGSGPPLVLVPGIQGRWPYVQPAVDALSTLFRVITFSLCGERSSGMALDPARGMDNYADQIDAAMSEAGVRRAPVCGISFGGLAALRFAASRPERTAALILVSTPGPGWHLRPRHQLYARYPRIFGPLFLVESPRRLRDELASALPRASDRLRFSLAQLGVLLRAPISVTAMANRALLISATDVRDDCSRITAPTLVVTGEHSLDHVVSADGSADYAKLIQGASRRVIEQTGHLGSITRPDIFARIVGEFVGQHMRFTTSEVA